MNNMNNMNNINETLIPIVPTQADTLRDALSTLSGGLRRKHESNRKVIAATRLSLAQFLTDTNDASLGGLRDAMWFATTAITELVASSVVNESAHTQIDWVVADYPETASAVEILFTVTRLVNNVRDAFHKSTSSSGHRDIAYIHNESVSSAVDSILNQLYVIERNLGLLTPR